MKTGIYQIRNIINNDLYVGSASISLKKRKNQHVHLLRSNKHHSIILQRAWNKYGEENFVFEVLEFCEPSKCIEREQYWIDKLKPKYNISIKAQSRLGTKITDPKILEKFKNARINCNWKITEEGRKKISDTHKGVPKTKEHIMKVAEFSKKKILQYSKEGNLIKEWNSIKEAEDYYKLKQGSLWRVLSKKKHHKTCRGFIWKYKDGEVETKIDISEYKYESSKVNYKSIVQLEKNGSIIQIWESISKAAKETNICYNCIMQCLLKKSKTAGGFLWNYYDNK